MTPLEQLFLNLLNIDVWLFVKLAYIIALLLYLVFAFMVIREVDHMNRTLKGVFNLPIKLIALLHFVFATLVLFLAIIVL